MRKISLIEIWQKIARVGHKRTSSADFVESEKSVNEDRASLSDILRTRKKVKIIGALLILLVVVLSFQFIIGKFPRKGKAANTNSLWSATVASASSAQSMAIDDNFVYTIGDAPACAETVNPSVRIEKRWKSDGRDGIGSPPNPLWVQTVCNATRGKIVQDGEYLYTTMTEYVNLKHHSNSGTELVHPYNTTQWRTEKRMKWNGGDVWIENMHTSWNSVDAFDGPLHDNEFDIPRNIVVDSTQVYVVGTEIGMSDNPSEFLGGIRGKAVFYNKSDGKMVALTSDGIGKQFNLNEVISNVVDSNNVYTVGNTGDPNSPYGTKGTLLRSTKTNGETNPTSFDLAVNVVGNSVCNQSHLWSVRVKSLSESGNYLYIGSEQYCKYGNGERRNIIQKIDKTKLNSSPPQLYDWYKDDVVGTIMSAPIVSGTDLYLLTKNVNKWRIEKRSATDGTKIVTWGDEYGPAGTFSYDMIKENNSFYLAGTDDGEWYIEKRTMDAVGGPAAPSVQKLLTPKDRGGTTVNCTNGAGPGCNPNFNAYALQKDDIIGVTIKIGSGNTTPFDIKDEWLITTAQTPNYFCGPMPATFSPLGAVSDSTAKTLTWTGLPITTTEVSYNCKVKQQS